MRFMARKRRRSAQQEHAADVATYVAAGGEESVQRVITALYGVTKKLDQWYVRQFADLDLTQGEWSVLASLARAGDTCLTPSQLADLSNVAPSSMTHRLDKMAGRGLLQRRPDESNRTRILVSLTTEGWALFSAAVRGVERRRERHPARPEPRRAQRAGRDSSRSSSPGSTTSMPEARATPAN